MKLLHVHVKHVAVEDTFRNMSPMALITWHP
jgi:hypothetical protein